MTGRGGDAGSWKIRGEQLGKAIGATVEPNANSVKGYDLAVVVKRPRADLLTRLRQRGVPLVWDVVDAWPQPEGNLWERDQCMAWLRKEVETVRPEAIVAATQAMAADLQEITAAPVLALPHHARPGLARNPIRARIETLGYEGGEQYLGHWRERLENECEHRGWQFIVGPRSLAELDVVVALRSQQGYAARTWKSNVKLANAQGSGTPIVCSPERGYEETQKAGVMWAVHADGLRRSLDALLSQNFRLQLQQALMADAPQLEDVASRYKKWLMQIAAR